MLCEIAWFKPLSYITTEPRKAEVTKPLNAKKVCASCVVCCTYAIAVPLTQISTYPVSVWTSRYVSIFTGWSVQRLMYIVIGVQSLVVWIWDCHTHSNVVAMLFSKYAWKHRWNVKLLSSLANNACSSIAAVHDEPVFCLDCQGHGEVGKDCECSKGFSEAAAEGSHTAGEGRGRSPGRHSRRSTAAAVSGYRGQEEWYLTDRCSGGQPLFPFSYCNYRMWRIYVV